MRQTITLPELARQSGKPLSGIAQQKSAPSVSGIAQREARTDNRNMTHNEWQRRIQRAEELAAQYSFAAEILRFYGAVARFQENFSLKLAQLPGGRSAAAWPSRFFCPCLSSAVRGSCSYAVNFAPERAGAVSVSVLQEETGP